MAINMKRNEQIMDTLNKLELRIEKAELEIKAIFSAYTIPADVTDYMVMKSYALIQIGDDVALRNEFNKKVADAQKSFADKADTLKEDFLFMVENGNKNLDKTYSEIQAEEQKLIIDEEEKTINEEKLDDLELEIDELTEQKEEIGGTTGKDGQIGVVSKEIFNLSKEQDAINVSIKDIEKEILAIEAKKIALEATKSTLTTQDEREKYFNDMSELDNKKATLINSKANLTQQWQDKDNLKRERKEYIRIDLQPSYEKLDAEIGIKNTDKTRLEDKINFLPSRRPELDKIKSDFIEDEKKFNESVEKLKIILISKGIDLKTKTPEVKDDKQPEDKNNKTPNNGTVNYGTSNTGVPNNKETLPVVTPEQKKRKNFEYITGYTDNGIGLSPDDRLKRIQSELGGRDYEAMVGAFEELKNSPVKLTRQEKNKVKEMMKLDKEKINQTVKGIDVDSLDKLLRSVGVRMNSGELESLHEDYSGSKYGVLDGFTKMSADNQAKISDAIKAYGSRKENMSEQDKKDFEKNILTPVKFGTLQEQTNMVCGNPFTRFAARLTGESRKLNDIRAAIAEIEVPEGQELSSRSRSRDFVESLRDQTITDPPNNERENRSDNNRNRTGR